MNKVSILIFQKKNDEQFQKKYFEDLVKECSSATSVVHTAKAKKDCT